MSNPQHTRWTVRADGKEVPLVGPPIHNDTNALQLGQGVSKDLPDAHVQVTGWFRSGDGWDTGTELGQFRAGELLPRDAWT